ncbi:ABC transporter permease [Bauldia sp.]|uniref:ABC transporter permease n=1 Tax=Bauldia sp. TaxID=2575872 RepID=UPI003BAB2D95
MERLLKSYFILVLALMYLPVLVIVLFSFNDSEFMAFPITGLTLDWYAQAIDDNRLIGGFLNTLSIAAPTAAISTTFGALAALALTRFRFRGRLVFAALLVVPFFIPKIILAVSEVIAMSLTGIPHGVGAIIAAQSLVILPFSVMVIASVLVRLDRRLEEAAADLGANGWQVFTRVLLPLMRNGLVASFFIAFVLSTAEYVVTSFVSGRTQPLSVMIASDFRFHLSPKVYALATLIVLGNLLLVAVSEVVRRRAKGALG